MAERVLIVDDDAEMASMVASMLSPRGYDVVTASTAEEAVDHLAHADADAVVTDLRLGDDSGIDLCRRIDELRPGVPVIVLTAFGSMESAIAAIRAGAYDFLNKPVDLEALALAVKRAVEHRQLRVEVEQLRESVEPPLPGDIIGESPAMKKVYDLMDRVGDSEASVLITGESGTGKELVARALHDRSRRQDGPFVAINCAAISAHLLESELFGHVRGAFTDAKQDKPGLFVESSGGTLFLDEIGEMPLEMQTKLLRALQERRVRPVGGAEELEFDTRILTATNIDIDAAVDAGHFREDLFYRINVVRIRVPPLRARGNDILLMAQHFIDQLAAAREKRVEGIVPEAARKLLEYDWPGNVRELQNVIERAVTLTRFNQIAVDDLPDKIRDHEAEQLVVAADDPEHLPTLEELERRYIGRVLEATKGNKTQAAKILGLDRRTLYRKLERYESGGD